MQETIKPSESILTSRSLKYVDVFVLKRKLVLTYSVENDCFTEDISGRLVEIPLRSGTALGCIIGEVKKPDDIKILGIGRFIGKERFIDEENLYLADFMRSYYGYPLESCLLKIFPPGLFSCVIKTVSLKTDAPALFSNASKTFAQLKKREKMNFDNFLKKIKSENNTELYKKSISGGFLETSLDIPASPDSDLPEKTVFVLTPPSKFEDAFDKTVFDFILSCGDNCELSKLEGNFGERTVPALSRLVRKKVLRTSRVNQTLIRESIELTPDQKSCADSITNGCDETFLLHGVTGSGKTFVYSRCIEKAVEKGSSALYLVPEIALIPQTLRFFSKIFPSEKILSYHSMMTPKKRFDAFRKARDGNCSVLVGTRSAIFLPLKNTGIIVVDEEHSPHYKEEDSGPFYSARDIAVWKGKKRKIPVILGSATPSAETIFNAKRGKYRLLSLTKRISDTKMPVCTLVPVSKSRNNVISEELKKELASNYANNQQAILFINRRGHSNYVICPACSAVINCQCCNVSMTFHENAGKLICHYCGKEKKLPESCPSCSYGKLHLHGAGTEKIEKELKRAIPGREILRLDTDVLKKTKHGHDTFFKDFHSGKYPVLVGTQMISKGLDFPGVSLVGIIDADSALSFPDFRASENAFQLIVQTAGRAGRVGQESKVLIQTSNPSDPVLVYAKNHDYDGFMAKELKLREEVRYPPFSRLARIVTSSTNSSDTEKAVKIVKTTLEKSIKNIEILGPAPCPLEKIRSNYRWHLLVKAPKNILLGERIMNSGIWRLKTKARIYLDIDPLRML